jgi:hypothetical protein
MILTALRSAGRRLTARFAASPRGTPALVVVGMHRSGTSAVARVANLLGFAIAKNLLEPQHDNPLGFWEPKGLVDLNDELLAYAGRDWHDPRPIAPAIFKDLNTPHWIARAEALLKAEFPSQIPITLKDPRLCRLLPFWQHALRQAGYRPIYLFVHRNPLDVAKSLLVRNGISMEQSQLLWLAYNLEALEALGKERLLAFLSYDQLIENGPTALMAVIGLLRIRDALSNRNIDVEAAVADLEPGQRHSKTSNTALAESGDVSELVKEVYFRLSDQRGRISDSELRSFLTRWREAWRVFCPTGLPPIWPNKAANDVLEPEPRSI